MGKPRKRGIYIDDKRRFGIPPGVRPGLTQRAKEELKKENTLAFYTQGQVLGRVQSLWSNGSKDDKEAAWKEQVRIDPKMGLKKPRSHRSCKSKTKRCFRVTNDSLTKLCPTMTPERKELVLKALKDAKVKCIGPSVIKRLGLGKCPGLVEKYQEFKRKKR